MTITRGWMCPQNKKISSIGAHYQHCWAPLILSTSKRIESATTFILSKGTTQHFWITMNGWPLGKIWKHLYKLECTSNIFLLSAISKNLVIAALKGKTSMVLSPQNWQLDTPEGKDWYINVVERRWWFRMLSENQCPLSQHVFVFVFFFDKFEYNIIFTSPNRNNFCVKVDSQLIINL